MPRPIITLLTDFGLTDHYVAAMKGVMLGICPDAQLVDITHQIPAYNVPEGAWTLSQTWKCFPSGTIHVAVVDPGVGSVRRPIAVKSGQHLFVGPDNGLFTHVLGAESRAFEIVTPEYMRQPVSRTFHGRDIFAPVAARLASGLDIYKVGPAISQPVTLGLGAPTRDSGNTWTGTIVHIDAFGNLVSNFDQASFEPLFAVSFELRIGSQYISTLQSTYSGARAGEMFVIFGSGGFAEVSCFQGDAARMLGVRAGDPLLVRPNGRHRSGMVLER